MRYIAFDVETPNANNARISAIGVSVLEEGRIVWEYGTLVDPETHFDPFNTALTGISERDVRGAPTFPQLWQTLQPIFESGVLAAHNAPFDLSVLAKCLSWYGIDWRETVDYLCTCRMGRACWPQLENHKLNTLCAWRGIRLNHHDAASDSRACALLLADYLQQGMEPERWLRRYDLAARRTLPAYRGERSRCL